MSSGFYPGKKLIESHVISIHTKSLSGGLEHEWIFSIQLGMSSSQPTHIFQRGRLNHQPDKYEEHYVIVNT